MKISNNFNILTVTHKNAFKSNHDKTLINDSKIVKQNEIVNDLEDLTIGMSLLSLMLGSLDATNMLSKEKVKKFPIIIYATTFLLIIVTSIKKFNLNKKQEGFNNNLC